MAQLCDDNNEVKAVILTSNGRFVFVCGDIEEMAYHGDAIGIKIKELAEKLHEAISKFVIYLLQNNNLSKSAGGRGGIHTCVSICF